MNTLDLLILGALAGGLFMGYRSGLIKQVLSFVGLIVAFVLSLSLMQGVGAMAAGSLGISEKIAPLVGFVIVFLAVQVGVFALIRLAEGLVGVLRLTSLNRLLGGGVGAFKAALILSVVFLVLGYLGVPSEKTRERSAFYEPISTVMPAAWDYMASAFPQVEQISERFGRELEDRVPQIEPNGE
ncbi:MAG: CvpA family protein [Rhodothermales bacterium]